VPVSMQPAEPAAAPGTQSRPQVPIREALARPKKQENLRRSDPNRWRSVQWCALGSLGVAMLTWAGYRLQFNFAAASLCFLLLIVFQSLTGDFPACFVVSLVALGSLDYFFTSPILSFRVGHPINILALFCFLATALVITRLVSTVRDKAELSYAQNQKTQQLYEVAQHLLAADPREASGTFLEPFRGAFGVRAACLFDAESSELHAAGNSEFDLQRRTRDAFIRGQNDDDKRCGVFVRCIRVAGRTTGR